MNKKYIHILILLLLLILIIACQPEQSSNTYQVAQPVVAGGGCGV